MIKELIYIILVIGFISCRNTYDNQKNIKAEEIQIVWVDSLIGDFSFTKHWDYPEGVYRNEFGQLSCDGLCPPEVEKMKDENGKIILDSLTSFYQLVDTTHQMHTIEAEAWTYEWAGVNFATAYRKDADTTICYTHNNIATHSSLVLTIVDDKCIPVIEVSGISSVGTKNYKCKEGNIQIDRFLWEKGILKANFNFIFNHPENPKQSMYWKGKIYTAIDKK